MNCPLCNGAGILVNGPDSRRFYRCPRCFLIYVDSADYPTEAEEREFYGTHQNDINDERYRRFLSQIVDAIRPHLSSGMIGLDYGCGPVKMIETLLDEEGYQCTSFDPLFYPVQLKGPYDFVIATEVVEHFRNTALEWQTMIELVYPGGLLAVMTELQPEKRTFRGWRYARDPTHTSFYHRETIALLSQRYALSPVYSDERRCFVFRKHQPESA